jgi:hypothetical protein
MLGHLVSGRYASGSDGYVHAEPAHIGWLRRVLGALFRRH